MRFSFLTSAPWPTSGGNRFAWYSRGRRAFVAGDNDHKVAFPLDSLTAPVTIRPPESPKERSTPYDDLLPEADYAELALTGRDGFTFLGRNEYARALPSYQCSSLYAVDLVLEFGIGNNLVPVRHPASGAMFQIRGNNVTQVTFGPSGLLELGSTRLRGKGTAIAFAAHPREPAIVYGTNSGHVGWLSFTASGLGKQRKVDSLPRNVIRLAFHPSGDRLLVSSLGEFRVYDLAAGTGRGAAAVGYGDFTWLGAPGSHVLANSFKGLGILELSGTQLTEVASIRPPFPAGFSVSSDDGTKILVATKSPGRELAFYQRE